MERQLISGSTAEPRCRLVVEKVGHGRTLGFMQPTHVSLRMQCIGILFMFTMGMYKSHSLCYALDCSSFLDYKVHTERVIFRISLLELHSIPFCS